MIFSLFTALKKHLLTDKKDIFWYFLKRYIFYVIYVTLLTCSPTIYIDCSCGKGCKKNLTLSPSVFFRGCDEKDIGQGTAAVLSESRRPVFFNNAVSVKTLILGHFWSLRKIWAGNILGGGRGGESSIIETGPSRKR